jgi:hypothetical protein
MNLIPGDITGNGKRAGINKVLAWVPSPVTIPEDLALVLDRGLVGGGLAFKTLKWAQLATLIDFARSWEGLELAGAKKESCWRSDESRMTASSISNVPLSKLLPVATTRRPGGTRRRRRISLRSPTPRPS